MITLTTAAALKLKAILDKQGKPEGFLRLKVTSGGCSGLNLNLEITDRSLPGDEVFESHGAKVAVDPKSGFFLYGSEVDYKTSLMESGFTVKNPNAATTCSCGQSFST